MVDRFGSDLKDPLGGFKGARKIAPLHGTSLEELQTKSRKRQHHYARREIAHFLRHERNWSLLKIGALLHRHHTTVLYMLSETRRNRMHSRYYNKVKPAREAQRASF